MLPRKNTLKMGVGIFMVVLPGYLLFDLRELALKNDAYIREKTEIGNIPSNLLHLEERMDSVDIYKLNPEGNYLVIATPPEKSIDTGYFLSGEPIDQSYGYFCEKYDPVLFRNSVSFHVSLDTSMQFVKSYTNKLKAFEESK